MDKTAAMKYVPPYPNVPVQSHLPQLETIYLIPIARFTYQEFTSAEGSRNWGLRTINTLIKIWYGQLLC